MSEEEFEKLPLDQLLAHKLWKARQLGYSKLRILAENNVNDPEIHDLLENPERLRKIVADPNVLSQETAIHTLCEILKRTGKQAVKTREFIVPVLVEKGIISSKIGAKNDSIECLLIYVEIDTPDPVIELMVPSLGVKNPKQVTATIKAINAIYAEFGCDVVSPKLIMEHITKMFAHSDRNVRAEASSLSVTIRSYMGDSFDVFIFPKLKSIQQKDLTKLFDKIEPGVKPKRLLFRDRERLESNVNLVQSKGDDDIVMQDAITANQEEEKFDPYELEEPVDVLSKLPTDLSSRISDPIWKERVAVLEEISKLFKVMKIKNDDFSDFIGLMVKCLKDVNLQVLSLSCSILVDLVNGLKRNFERYVRTIINPLLERTKEKKRTILDSLNNVLDLCFKYGRFEDILEPIVEHMSHIAPPVKVESMHYLVRCLKELEEVPKKHEVEIIMEPAIKLLQDSQLPVRNAASEVIGVLLKMIGPDNSRYFIDKIDKRHVKKVLSICDSTTVKALRKSIHRKSPISAKTEAIPDLRNKSTVSVNDESRKVQQQHNDTSMNTSSIPSKRMATSPLKKDSIGSKSNLTSRSLKASNISNFGMASQQVKELETLRAEKLEWMSLKKNLTAELEDAKHNNETLLKDIVTLNGKLDDYHNKFTTMSMTLKSKDTQIFRLKSDLENFQTKNIQYQQKIKMLENQLKNASTSSSSATSFSSTKPVDPVNSTDLATESNDINRRISILSIDSNNGDGSFLAREESPSLQLNQSTLYNFDDNDDGWKRATAVTNDLKAKIQMMKARTRVLDHADD